MVDDRTPTDNSASSSVCGNTVGCSANFGKTTKVPCTTIRESLPNNDTEGLSTWITKSNLKSSSRRQSLDILFDAGDRVKDAFATGFQKVGKSLERRNSESEVASESSSTSTSDFFSFGRYVYYREVIIILSPFIFDLHFFFIYHIFKFLQV